MASIDTSLLVTNIVTAVRGELTTSLGDAKVFVTDQSKKLAAQAAMIAESRVSGSLRHDDHLYKFFIEDLKRNTKNVVLAVSAHLLVTFQKIWNAIVGAVWGAINQALGAANLGTLAIPKPPKLGV